MVVMTVILFRNSYGTTLTSSIGVHIEPDCAAICQLCRDFQMTVKMPM